MIPESFFRPRGVLIVGASQAPGRIGSGLVETMKDCGAELYLLNPSHDRLYDLPCYHAIRDLPALPSHAYIAVRRDLVLPYLRDCLSAGIQNVVVISSGFKEKDALGAELERQIEDLAQTSGACILGPNTLGLINCSVGFNGTFLPANIRAGAISVISQSGGVGMALLSALADQHCGIAKWIGIGNEAGIRASDALAYLADDPETGAVAVCFEGLRDLPGFLRLASEVNRKKPIVFLRDGKSSVGLRAAASHTGAMVYSGSVIPSLLRQFGLLEASSTRDCAAMLKALSLARPASGCRAVLLTNTAGPAVLAADTMEAAGVRIPPLSDALSRAIDAEAGVAMELKNPADISSNGLSPRNYGIAARGLLCSDQYDILLGFFSLNSHLLLPEKELIAASEASGKPVVACLLSSQAQFADYSFAPEEAGIPCYCDPHDAAVAVSAIAQRALSLHREPSPTFALSPDRHRAVAALLNEKDCAVLSERESRELLKAAGAELFVPMRAESPNEAVRAAQRCGFPAVLKIESNVITHKAAAGGVRLGLPDENAVYTAATDMLSALRVSDPHAVLTVQPTCGDGFELILGAVRSPLGVLLMAGMGGSFAEELQDRAFCLAPADESSLRRMLLSLRCARVLYEEDGTPRFREAAVLELLGTLASLLESFPRIAELEINPCRLSKGRPAILDARAILST